MKVNDVVKLIKSHYEKNNEAFDNQALSIAKEFYSNGQDEIGRIIENLLYSENNFVPQNSSYSFSNVIEKMNTRMVNGLYYPDKLNVEILGICNSISNNSGLNKFLFSGKPGTGKTEICKYIANYTDRQLFLINFTNLIDSRLGETLKNIESLFASINNTYNLNRTIFLFDEIDIIALDRININDVREMGRATSLMLRCLDRLNENAIIIATTNMQKNLDKALMRRFDYNLNFDVYTKDDLAEIAWNIAREYKKGSINPIESRLVKKIIKTSEKEFTPSELRNFIKISFAFSSEKDEFNYITRFFKYIYSHELSLDLNFLKKKGFSIREMEIISGISKSSICRILSEED